MVQSETKFSLKDKTLPLVTIVTPSYNQGQYLERTILSVLKQDYPNIEYIVIDALSTDETEKILGRFRNRISKVVRERDNGQSDAINKGFVAGRGEIMAYLNSDDCYANPSVVSDAVSFLMANPDVDLVYGRRYEINDQGYFLAHYPYRQFSKKDLYLSCYIPQECCFWTKQIYDKAGGFIDTSYKFAIDYELWLRLLHHGANFAAIDKIFGLFRLHEQSKTVNNWLDVGYSEAKLLIERYTGRTIPILEMYDHYFRHYFNLCRRNYQDEATILSVLWQEHVDFTKTVLGRAPLDLWGYRDFLQNAA
jgi:glycosyltransferase involved in cell wall biosynthesis